MDKSPEAFRTISEVADFLETPAHVLRFWESRFPQIRPVKRAGGRRYYRPGDVALLAGIKRLLHDEGLTIRGVQKILREQGIRHVASLGSGDAPAALLDSDIEAVLSAEYGPASRAGSDLRPSDEALQSAQIISLETALNRQDSLRSPGPVQADLWPADPEDVPLADEVTEAWPGDPGAMSGDDLAAASDDVESTRPQEVARQVDSPMTATEATFPTQPDLSVEGEGMAVDRAETRLPAEETTASAPPFDESGVESPMPGADGAGEDEDEAATASVASLLRRVSPTHVAHVQPDLARLRDRLIDLRGRVAEAARRRAK